jgi:translation elongation factor EF-Tu-like GTPase
VCRQLYEETNILPFKLNSVDVSYSIFSHVKAVLSDAQRNAISIVRISDYDATESLHRQRLVLAQLGGLKRVIVEVSEKECMSEDMLQALLDEVKSCVEGRDLKVEVEIMSKYLPCYPR